ncbi:hypothetical protein AB0F30_16760 [Streptomyces sp. NPDC029006]|uniref:hypothetical protein n=1 Tax=Streptomyces sp. NPDC029006 TaxID=3155467 RepID=UPI0033CB0848
MTDRPTGCHPQDCCGDPTAHQPAPAAVGVAPAADQTEHGAVREQLLHALDFNYVADLGYETPEALLAAYDASQTTPAADRTDLRDRIAAALRRAPFKELCADWTAPNGPLQITAQVDDLASAVLAALPDQRAAILGQAADALDADMERFFAQWPDEPRNSPYALGRKDAADELRRMAAGAQQQPAPVAPQPAALRGELKPWQLLAGHDEVPPSETEQVLGGRRLSTAEPRPAADSEEETHRG